MQLAHQLSRSLDAGILAARGLAQHPEGDCCSAASALRRSEAFFAEAQRLSATGSFSWRPATDQISWSDEAYRIFEYPARSRVTLGGVMSRIYPDDLVLVRRAVARARRHVNDCEYECRLMMPDRSVKYLHVVARATRAPEGGIEFIGAIQDITERRLSQLALNEARAELARMARITALGALAPSIAHELGQPLAGIVTNAETCVRMLSGDPPNVAVAIESARRSIRDGIRASDIITSLRSLFTRRSTSPEPVNLSDAVREVMHLYVGELHRRQVALQLDLAEDLPPVLGHRVQLQQVILNLLMNASDSMREINDRPRHLFIQTAREKDRVNVTVRDTGIGFRSCDLDKLFDAFYSTKEGGMGIGLSISRFIIDSHCGRLWASLNQGPGASFSFSLPRFNHPVRISHAPQ